VSKPTVINYFVDCALNRDPLTVYEPGTQARNFIHVKDVARAYVQSTERLLEQLDCGETGTKTYEIASHEEMSVMTLAEIVRDTAAEVLGIDADIDLVENPRTGETMVEEFSVDISAARNQLNWEPTKTVQESVRQLLQCGG
jgi:UDP-glucose 4-epimerase